MTEKQFASPQEALAHYGVKGMRWGVRKAEAGGGSSRPGLSDRQKKALKVGGAALAIGGAAVAINIMARRGVNPVRTISQAVQTAQSVKGAKPTVDYAMGTAKKFTTTNKHGTSEYGSHAVKAFEDSLWKKNVAKLQAEIAAAHRTQTQSMIRDSARSGMSYNPARDNAFSPEARQS